MSGHFLIDLPDRTIDLTPGKGVVIPKGTMHRPRAPEKSVILMVGTRGDRSHRHGHRVKLRRLLLALAICWVCANLPAAEPDVPVGDWKFISGNDNVTLYRRPRSGPGHYESKAIGEIDASTDVVHAVLDDVESYAGFMPYTAECRVLKRESDSVLTYQRITAPFVSDRDYTLRVRTSSKAGEGGTSYFSRWETENANGPPEKRGVVRVNLCEGSWWIEPAGPRKTRATYVIYTDSGSAIPGFIKNAGSQIGIRKIFAALRKQVREPKYNSPKN